MKTNYSYKTSLPAHRENPEGKKAQKEKILEEFKRLGGSACLKQIEHFMNIPQSSCAGRINDLIKDGLVEHKGHVKFENKLRKSFSIVETPVVSISPPPVPEPVITPPNPSSATHSIDPPQRKLDFGT